MQSALAIRPVPLGPQTPCHQHLGKPHDPMVRAIMTFVAGTRRGCFANSAAGATICAVRAPILHASGMLPPYIVSPQLHPATPLRASAQNISRNRYRGAYRQDHSRIGELRISVQHEVPGPCTNQSPYARSPLPVSFNVDTSFLAGYHRYRTCRNVLYFKVNRSRYAYSPTSSFTKAAKRKTSSASPILATDRTKSQASCV